MNRTFEELFADLKAKSSKERQIFSAEHMEISVIERPDGAELSCNGKRIKFQGTEEDKARVLACVMGMLQIPCDPAEAAAILGKAACIHLQQAERG